MLISILTLLLLLPLAILGNCNFSNFSLEPGSVVLNSTYKTKLICTKIKDDNHGFEVNLSPNISEKYIQISTNDLNNTAIEIILQSFDYIGKFHLICSSKGEKDCSTRSNITIGQKPGLIERAGRCTVFYDKYIDCIISAPTLVPMIINGLNYKFRFKELRLPSQPNVYRSERGKKPVKIDSINKTLTFRWFPKVPEYFPLDLRMIIYGTIIDFGTTNHTMNMVPIFRISSNFTVKVISPTDLQIEFNPGKIPSICHGNLTLADQIQLSYQKKHLRTFQESNQTTIYVTGLHPNTLYQLCFHCRRHARFSTISDIECQEHKTLKRPIPPIYIIILVIFCLLFVSLVQLLISRCKNDVITKKISRCRVCRKKPTEPTEPTYELIDLEQMIIPQ